MKCTILQIKKTSIFILILLFVLSCKKDCIEIFKNQTDSSPKYLVLNNDTLFDYNKDERIAVKHKNDRDTIHYREYSNPENFAIFQKLELKDFGFRSDQILISFEPPLDVNGFSFKAEISNYDYLFIKYYDFQSQKYVLKINLKDKDKKLLKELLSNLNQYKEVYKSNAETIYNAEKLLIIYHDEDKERIIYGDLYLMPEPLKTLIAVIYMYISKNSKNNENDDLQDLPSYKILENYENKTGIGYKFEPEPR